jgi:hypothetical protein
MSKMTALWNKIGRSIVAAEQSKEAFGLIEYLYTASDDFFFLDFPGCLTTN